MSGSARLRELLAASTPGPWTWADHDEEPGCFHALTSPSDNVLEPDAHYGDRIWIEALSQDARLIALAPELASIVCDLLDNVAICSRYDRFFVLGGGKAECRDGNLCDACQLRTRVEALL